MDDDRDSLPEWCLEDAEEEMGTFDSSGAFLSLKVKSCLGPFFTLSKCPVMSNGLWMIMLTL